MTKYLLRESAVGTRCGVLAAALVLVWCTAAVAEDAAIAKAMEALRQAAPRAAADPTRPVYHFLPPAQWMNDACGGIYQKGYYHLFYQLNPYADHWADIHWGHARSRDLVYWEHLPIALAPTSDELRCNSGCVTINKEGTPMIFYTSVPKAPGPRDHRAAVGDDDLITWKRHPANPILTLDNHGGPKFGGGWSDCYIFAEAGRTFMVIGVDSFGEEVVVPLYEAQNTSLTKWKYRGLLFRASKKKLRNMEVPVFFKLDGKWVLLVHPGGPIRYWIGSFDLGTLTFQPQSEGNLTHNYGEHKAEGVSCDRGFSSPHVFFDEKGRCILYGWISGFKDGCGWNGCLGLPRVLSIGPDGLLRQRPAAELERLRGEHFGTAGLNLKNGRYVFKNANGDTLEIRAAFEADDANSIGLKVRCSRDGKRAATIRYDGQTLDASGVKVPLLLSSSEKVLTLQVFLDRSVMEVFVNDGREAVAKVIYPDEKDVSIALFASGGTAKVKSLDVWHMKSIWPESEK
ncbi:MAG TPA: glycoside hydrolase family 32 protein [Sedimentisphaerales bacterium]|nr:glycoside hydrolase family 32 protein [Sedimentisphaerales bacterium]